MKRYLVFMLCLLGIETLVAQTPYPTTPPAAVNIVRLEYFIDTDPGQGNGTAITITSQTNINNLSATVDLTALTKGFHRLHIRARDANGLWSFYQNSFFSNVVVPVYPSVPAAPVHINKLEYFLDIKPVPGTGVDVPITSGTSIANQNIVVDISALSKGVHILYVGVRDASGNWSLTNFSIFSNSTIEAYPAAPPAVTNLQQLEYFIDTDPGFGNGIPVSFGATTNLADLSINVDLTSLADGEHVLFIRSRSNPWSQTNVVPFLKGSGLPVKWLYVKGEMKNDQALLQWATGYEENTERFDIEQSSNGRDFKLIGTVAAAGKSTVTRYYSFADRNSSSGWNYYRIKQIDIDGKSSYSRVITLLRKETTDKMLLYPNPAIDQVYIEWPSSEQWTSLELFTVSGHLLKTISLTPATPYKMLDVQDLQNGLYMIRFKNQQSARTIRFSKVK